MSYCTPEQHRKKAEAMREADKALHNTVDGSRSSGNHSSHMAHLPMGGAKEEKMEGGY